jgi:heme/copper-type cytochrome/quinol oxidase subunit 2
MQSIIDLHHDIVFFLIAILSVVLWMGARIAYEFHRSRQPNAEQMNHHTQLELVRSFLPGVIVSSRKTCLTNKRASP